VLINIQILLPSPKRSLFVTMLARQTLIRISPLLRGQTARFFAANAQADLPSVKLYQYAICPFCNQAKAILSYAGIAYDVVEVNPLTKAELKPWSVTFHCLLP
jgi:hypothetical protein